MAAASANGCGPRSAHARGATVMTNQTVPDRKGELPRTAMLAQAMHRYPQEKQYHTICPRLPRPSSRRCRPTVNHIARCRSHHFWLDITFILGLSPSPSVAHFRDTHNSTPRPLCAGAPRARPAALTVPPRPAPAPARGPGPPALAAAPRGAPRCGATRSAGLPA